ncbi:MAG: nitroreductase family protein [Candidatus Bathyarchaeota archaeon]|nr:MAG: nitroreductase family protein [Candidatus Bathyarchaeota archaeon]
MRKKFKSMRGAYDIFGKTRRRCLTENAPKILQLLFTRKTIRRFKPTQVVDAVVQKIVEAGQRAPSACNLQTYTIIWISNPQRRKRVLDACGVSTVTAPVILVICADVRRLGKTLDSLGFDHCLEHGYGNSLKLLSIVDAALAAENMTIAAECYGLGSLFIGSALANQKLCEILKVPEGVLPLSLLCIGRPDEEPPTRPRLPLSSILQINEYRDASPETIKSYLQHMDYKLDEEGYYQKYGDRKLDYHYTNHIKGKTDPDSMKREDREIEQVLKKKGFLLEKP